MSETTWAELAAIARWAPSPHNTQHWRLSVVDATHAVIAYEPSRLLPLTDATGQFQTIGLGIFVEALEIAARSRGLRLRLEGPPVELDDSTGPVRPFMPVALEPIVEPGEFEASLLRERRTSRIRYNGTPVRPQIAAELSGLANGSGHEIAFTSDPAEVAWMVDLNIETLFYDLRHQPARDEIRLWIRKTEREARRARDGFSPKCIGFSGHLINGFFGHHRLFDTPGIRHVIRLMYAQAYRGSATVGWIIGPQAGPQDWFDGGRLLLRFWLGATRAGLVLHPFGSVITNPAAHARLVERISIEKAGHEAWLLFRIGQSRTPARSLRLPVEEILR